VHVQIIVWGEIILFSLFGIVQLLRALACLLWQWKNWQSFASAYGNKVMEIIYICLSLSAKLLLGSILLAQVFINPQE
jgi:hypothetical protein